MITHDLWSLTDRERISFGPDEKKAQSVWRGKAILLFVSLLCNCKGCESVHRETTVEGLIALTNGAGWKLTKTRFIVVCKKRCLHGPAHMFALRWLSGPLKRKRCIALAAVLLTGRRYSVLSIVLNGFSTRLLLQRSRKKQKTPQ